MGKKKRKEKRRNRGSVLLRLIEVKSNMFKNSSDCKINNQTILKEHIDEHYQPTEDEIREYALYIGIDLDKVRRHSIELR